MFKLEIGTRNRSLPMCTIKKPIPCVCILHFHFLWIFLIKIVIYLVSWKFYHHGDFRGQILEFWSLDGRKKTLVTAYWKWRHIGNDWERVDCLTSVHCGWHRYIWSAFTLLVRKSFVTSTQNIAKQFPPCNIGNLSKYGAYRTQNNGLVNSGCWIVAIFEIKLNLKGNSSPKTSCA